MALEIERKFLMNSFPDGLEILREAGIWQGYLSVEPEVRIHRAVDKNTGAENYCLTVKGDGNLTRTEVKTDIDKAFYKESLSILPGDVIYKEYKSYRLGNYVLEVCHVEPEKETSFFYAEIEFASEEEAGAFCVPEYFGEEITHVAEHKMKNYWKRTRLGGM